MHVLRGDGIFVAAMILAVAEFSVTDGTGLEVVISLDGRSNFLNFCFSSTTHMWASSLLWGLSHDLETNKLAEVEEVEDMEL